MDALEASEFLDDCVANMSLGAVAELVVRLPLHCNAPDYQERIYKVRLFAKDDILVNFGRKFVLF